MKTLIGQSIGRYQILEELGQGGMATVYKALDTRLEREVAVKIIRRGVFGPEDLQRMLKRFEREAKALAGLTHPNIVGVIDYGEYKQSPYLVMPYLPGGTLKQKLGRPMPWQEAVKLLLPIAQALEYAHGHGVIHRDVKPSNVLMTEKGQPMLSDFGIAKILQTEEGATLTGAGVGVGTPEYMAPEQWIGKAGQQSDIYSLGIVLYEMVTGKKPYTAETPAAILLKQANEPLERPGKLVPGLPDVIEKVLLKALAIKTEDRYPDMAAFAATLEKLSLGLERAAEAFAAEAASGADATIYQEDSQEIGFRGVTRDDSLDRTTDRPSPAAAALPAQPVAFPWLLLGILGAALVIIVPLLIWVVNLGVAGRGPLAMLATPTTPFAAATEIPAPSYTTSVRPADGMTMVYVSGGEFVMGSPSNVGDSDEHPQHTVFLDAYWIDQTEVTNGMYALCVQSGACPQPGNPSSQTRSSYYGDSQFTSYPVVHVTWQDAASYCAWAGGRLPTEAEWELAARGTRGSIYPWGDGTPDSSLLNYFNILSDTAPVGSYPAGISPFGALDMAGNVWEWTADWYGENFYQTSRMDDPSGPSEGTYRVIRGGAYDKPDSQVRSTNRGGANPNASEASIGFRCVLEP